MDNLSLRTEVAEVWTYGKRRQDVSGLAMYGCILTMHYKFHIHFSCLLFATLVSSYDIMHVHMVHIAILATFHI